MLFVYAKVVIPTINQEKFKVLANTLVENTRKETGCVSYNFCELKDIKNVFAFAEKWQDKTALDNHLNSPAFKEIIGKISALASSELEVNVHEIIL